MFMSISSKTRASLPVIRYIGTAGFVIECFYHFYYVFVGRKDVEGLNLLQFFHFLQSVELFLHALNGHILARLQG